VRILRALHEEGLRVPEVLGPLAWAMRSAAEVAEATAEGTPFDRALGPRHGAWKAPQRRRILESAVRRHSVERWNRLLSRASLVDRRSKGDHGRLNRGVRRGQVDAWNELENLGLALCGALARRRSPYTGPTPHPRRTT
jgi:DNA polymerase III delta subunit